MKCKFHYFKRFKRRIKHTVLGSSGLFKENKSIINYLDEIKETIDKI